MEANQVLKMDSWVCENESMVTKMWCLRTLWRILLQARWFLV